MQIQVRRLVNNETLREWERDEALQQALCAGAEMEARSHLRREVGAVEPVSVNVKAEHRQEWPEVSTKDQEWIFYTFEFELPSEW